MNPLNIFRRKQPQRQIKASHEPVARLTRVEVDKRPAPRIDDAWHKQLAAETFGDPDARFRAAEGAEQ